MNNMFMTVIYCVDERHGMPCPQPCNSCLFDGCDTTATVAAINPAEAAKLAGWGEEYIDEVARTARS